MKKTQQDICKYFLESLEFVMLLMNDEIQESKKNINGLFAVNQLNELYKLVYDEYKKDSDKK
jgi:hypothetical protein